MSAPRLIIVVAVAENGVIGRDNGLPWRLSSDLKRFRALTWGKPVIMGRRTWESIGRPLPGREAVVLTRRGALVGSAAATFAHDWPGAKAAAAELAARMGAAEVAVIGGAELFRLALPEADLIHLTRVHASPPGDVVFPEFDTGAFRETFREEHPAGEADQHPFTYIDFARAAGR